MFKDPKIQLALGSFIVWTGDWTGRIRFAIFLAVAVLIIVTDEVAHFQNANWVKPV